MLAAQGRQWGDDASLHRVHAHDAGVLFGEVTEAAAALEADGADGLDGLREAIVEAYQLRRTDTTATGRDGVMGVEPGLITETTRPAIRRIVEVHIARQRSGIAVVEGWMADR